MFAGRINYTFLLVTLAIATFDGLLVWVSYGSSREALEEKLAHEGRQLRNTYYIAMGQAATFMRQTATLIANDRRVSELFYRGREAVEREGGGAGKERAAEIRAELFQLVSSGWSRMTEDFEGRQLHFHLPPDISFLRVHKPEKFGDDLSSIRHIIVATNRDRQVASGFESGRVYAGIRGVVPVFHSADEDAPPAHVGALEAGMSYTLLLHELQRILSAHFAVLMTLEHAQQTMWPDFLREYLKSRPVIDGYMLEAATEKSEVAELLGQSQVRALFADSGTVLAELDGSPYAVTAFGLRDYLGSVDRKRDDIGTVMVWRSAEDEFNAFRSGLWKNIIVAITGFIVIEAMIMWGLAQESRLRRSQYMATVDALTGVPNRRAFDETAETATRLASKAGTNLSVIMCDIDYFKQYNDTYGHAQGDVCLRQVAHLLQGHLRGGGDFLARYGGEEFVMLLPSTDEEAVRAVGDRLCSAVAGLGIPHAGNASEQVVTISCGIASDRFGLEGGEADFKALLQRADAALYAAKRQGRNCCAVG